MKITPREGDYIKLQGITADEYKAAAEAFIHAGYGCGEYGLVVHKGFLYFGISAVSKRLYHSQGAGVGSFPGRELSLSDLLGDEEVVWSGDGWPPVGTECEFSYNKVNWFATKILFMGSKMTVFTTDHTDETERSAFLREIIFRPLKSERELAIEEMTNKIDLSQFENYYVASVKEIIGDIYDLGYRKIKDAEK